MEKVLKLPLNIEVIEYVEQKSILIDFENTSVMEWCLGLVLLSEELIDKFQVTNGTKSLVIELHSQSQVSFSTRIEGGSIDSNIDLRINERELEYVLRFFLEYYRDGVSLVDHIDIDIEDPSSRGMDFSVTLKVAHILPSVSAEEARRRLGL